MKKDKKTMRTFGSDPELLLTLKGKPKSAIPVIKHDAENRIDKGGHQFYYDNVLAECAIKPGSSRDEVLGNFKEALQIYASLVSPCRLTAQACAEFPDKELQDEAARKVGCAPDWCAYEIKLKDPPTEAIQNGNLRSCGGHVHLGSETLAGDGPEPILAILLLDLFVGTSSLWLDRDPTSARRRSIYGQAGRYRTKDYGVEYRSLGNYWLVSPQMVGLTYDLCEFIQDFIEDGKGWDLWEFDLDVFYESEDLSEAWTCKAYNTELLRHGINQGDREMVKTHFALAKSLMPAGLKRDLEKMIDRPEDGDLYQNWKLN